MIKVGDKIKFTVKDQKDMPTFPPQIGLIYPFAGQTFEGVVEKFDEYLGVSINDLVWIGIPAMANIEKLEGNL